MTKRLVCGLMVLSAWVSGCGGANEHPGSPAKSAERAPERAEREPREELQRAVEFEAMIIVGERAEAPDWRAEAN